MPSTCRTFKPGLWCEQPSLEASTSELVYTSIAAGKSYRSIRLPMAPARTMSALLVTAAALLAVMAGCWWQPVRGTGFEHSTEPTQKRSKERFAGFVFYLHDSLRTTASASAFFVVPPLEGIPEDVAGNSLFGGVVLFDDLVTAGPEADSLALGRAKGIYVFDNDDVNAPGLEIVFTLDFNTASGFGGSSIQFRGFQSVVAPLREISVSGGTGRFRLARGWAQSTVSSFEDFSVVVKFTASVYYG